MGKITKTYNYMILRPGEDGHEPHQVDLTFEDMSDAQLMAAGYHPGATRAAGAPGPGYNQLAELIDPILGGHLEHVSVLRDGQPADMFVHDNGKNIGLPENPAASAIYRAHWLKTHAGVKAEHLHAIYGPAVIFRERVWF